MTNPTYNRVNTPTENSQVASMLGGSDGELGFRMIGIGCRVRNRYTLRWMNGTRTMPQIPSTAENRARLPGSTIAPRSSRHPTYKRKRNRLSVRLASHVHQVPHIGLAQLGP